MITPIDWPQLVAEAIRRRKAEGLTQLAHADLAGVSKPVIIAFDKGETTLSLGRALAILDVVGLVNRATPHQSFVTAAQARWQELTATLPPDDPARFPLGRYEMDYEIEGVHKIIPSRQLVKELESIDLGLDTRKTGLTGLPFKKPVSSQSTVHVIDDRQVEYWANNSPVLYPGPGLLDYWRVSTSGHAFLVQELEMDSQFLLGPRGEYFGLERPIHRATAVMLHAVALSTRLNVHNAVITFNTRYTGLARRKLANNEIALTSIGQSLSDRAELSITTTAAEIRPNLPALVHRFLTPLYQQFDGFVLDQGFVEREVTRLHP